MKWLVILMVLICPALAGASQSDDNAGRSRAISAGELRIRLTWATATESETFAYYIYRADAPDGEMACINSDSPVMAAGTSTTPNRYVFHDLDVEEGRTYYYKIQLKNLNGETEWIVGAEKPPAGKPKPLTQAEVEEILAESPVSRDAHPSDIPALPRGVAGGSNVVGVKILVEKNRMYRITGRDIHDASGVDLSGLCADRINLYHAGETVPVKLENIGRDGAILESTVLKFRGEFPRGSDTYRNLYTKRNAYILRFESRDEPHRFAPGGRLPAPTDPMGLTRTHRRTNHIEPDTSLIRFRAKGYRSDGVIWKRVRATAKKQEVVVKLPPVPDIATDAKRVKLRMLLLGESYLPREWDHDWDIAVNGARRLGSARWDDLTPHLFESELAVEELYGAGGSLVFTGNHRDGSIDSILLDWVELEYTAVLRPVNDYLEYTIAGGGRNDRVGIAPGFSGGPVEVFDLGRGVALDAEATPDPETGMFSIRYIYPIAGDGSRFAAVGPGGFARPAAITPVFPDLLTEIEDVPEYLVITTGEFLPEIEPLIQWRKNRGLRVMAVDVENIYNEYAHGMFSPGAIRLFVDDLLEKSNGVEGGLRYLFLVGGATFDYHNIKSRKINYVPTFHKAMTEVRKDKMPLYAYDDHFVLGRDGGGVGVPKIAVGRLPVTDAGVLRGFVEKLIEFERDVGRETAAPRGEKSDWRTKLLLIAAAGWERPCRKFVEADHFKDWEVARIFAERDAPEKNVELQGRIVEAIDAGQAMMFFSGHGAYAMWRTGPVNYKEQTDLFTHRHIRRLKNKGRYPIVFAATCYSAIFDTPFYPGFHVLKDGDEKIQVRSGIGVSLVEAPESGAIACIAHVAKTGAFPAMKFARFVCESLFGGAERLGDAFLYAKQKGKNRMHRGITLIGDPATFLGGMYGGRDSGFDPQRLKPATSSRKATGVGKSPSRKATAL